MDAALFVVPYRFLPPSNGGQKAAWGFAYWLGKARPLWVLSTVDNEPAAAVDVSFQLLPWLSKRPWRYVSLQSAIRLYRAIRLHSVRHLIVQQPFFALMAAVIARVTGARLYIYSHNLEYIRFRSMNKGWWPLVWMTEFLAYRLADHVLFISADERQPAIDTFGLQERRCHVLPYGTDLREQPEAGSESKEIRSRHNLPDHARILLFFGPLGYAPNQQALDRIIGELLPYREQLGDDVHLFICGGGLPAAYRSGEWMQATGFHYLGFVEDLDTYLQACDLMINPMESGAGIKTKVIEAIAAGLPVVSTVNGALGVDPSVCGDMLRVVPDGDYNAFRAAVALQLRRPRPRTPEAFFQHYHWQNCLQPLLQLMEEDKTAIK
jgi:glycosyltransferase involved in cell wall biosynthesis